MQRQGRKILLPSIKHKGFTFPPSLTPALTTSLCKRVCRALSAQRSTIRFGHRQKAHHGRTPEDSVCVNRQMHTGRARGQPPPPLVHVCYSMLREDELLQVNTFPCACQSPLAPPALVCDNGGGPPRSRAPFTRFRNQTAVTDSAFEFLLVPGRDAGSGSH